MTHLLNDSELIELPSILPDWEFLDGKYDLATMTDKAIAATRQLAKRQHTWLRSWPALHTLECNLAVEDGNIVKNALKNLSFAANYW